MAISDAVRELAFFPFLNVTAPPDWELVERDGVVVCLHKLPLPVIAHPAGNLVEANDVAAAVAAARAIAAEHGRSALIWWVGPNYAHLRPSLEAAGLVNEDAPGFEQTETPMAIDHEPLGADVAGLKVDGIRSLEDLRASGRVLAAAFGLPAGPMEEAGALMWEHEMDPTYPLKRLVARLDGEVVGTASTADAEHGINLLGAAVLPQARGRGVYRALVARRWEVAVAQGKPALTVQAGRMSRPILQRLGFEPLGHVHVYNDRGLPTAG